MERAQYVKYERLKRRREGDGDAGRRRRTPQRQQPAPDSATACPAFYSVARSGRPASDAIKRGTGSRRVGSGSPGERRTVLRLSVAGTTDERILIEATTVVRVAVRTSTCCVAPLRGHDVCVRQSCAVPSPDHRPRNARHFPRATRLPGRDRSCNEQPSAAYRVHHIRC